MWVHLHCHSPMPHEVNNALSNKDLSTRKQLINGGRWGEEWPSLHYWEWKLALLALRRNVILWLKYWTGIWETWLCHKFPILVWAPYLSICMNSTQHNGDFRHYHNTNNNDKDHAVRRGSWIDHLTHLVWAIINEEGFFHLALFAVRPRLSWAFHLLVQNVDSTWQYRLEAWVVPKEDDLWSSAAHK